MKDKIRSGFIGAVVLTYLFYCGIILTIANNADSIILICIPMTPQQFIFIALFAIPFVGFTIGSGVKSTLKWYDKLND